MGSAWCCIVFLQIGWTTCWSHINFLYQTQLRCIELTKQNKNKKKRQKCSNVAMMISTTIFRWWMLDKNVEWQKKYGGNVTILTLILLLNYNKFVTLMVVLPSSMSKKVCKKSLFKLSSAQHMCCADDLYVTLWRQTDTLTRQTIEELRTTAWKTKTVMVFVCWLHM